MKQVQNETVLAFLKWHKEHPNVRKALVEADRVMAGLNLELGTDYRGYLDYLERNSGDDAPCTMDQLISLAESDD